MAALEQKSALKTKGLKGSFLLFLLLFFISQSLFNISLLNKGQESLKGLLENNMLLLEISNEALCFSTVALLCFILISFKQFLESRALKYYIILGIFIFLVPIMSFMFLVQGRLVYPMPALPLDDANNILMQSLYLGCQHVAFLAFAGQALLFAFEKKISLFTRILSLCTGLLLILGSYSWLFSPWFHVLILLVQGFYGLYLLRLFEKKLQELLRP